MQLKDIADKKFFLIPFLGALDYSQDYFDKPIENNGSFINVLLFKR
ncbi:hypothetical protein SAMN00777080_1986 [Aquiflexum balticum DSM 16537]|jgi:hypothetical protein|uniref:Uncharacterized protein n=1 Tax=Aquiflexum balticum DSM 16537 TaxID=758820 RepID=A0A1W2H3Q5_9BACT|nr:hypothetical protein SAMN00777080_1986 [Aquiflexum balticum DSM 16537]